MADFDSRLPVRAAVTDVIVQVADSGTLTINPAKEDGNLLSVKNSLDIMDDWDDGSDRAKVNLTAIASSAPDIGIGNSSTGTLRVVLASDQPSIPFVIDEGNSDLVSYDTQAGLGTSLADTHTFTPAAACRVKKIQAAASGQMKIEIKWGPTGSETTKVVSFTSKGDLNFEISFPDGISLATTDSVLVIRTNMDNQAMDVYSSVVYQNN